MDISKASQRLPPQRISLEFRDKNTVCVPDNDMRYRTVPRGNNAYLSAEILRKLPKVPGQLRRN
ncbi:MAG TPA: hypothetical protein VJW95_05520 [Dissulfurispiraceae bacterium]|nr:hypothetical protein [Dissulfurispiraceae bacterium]